MISSAFASQSLNEKKKRDNEENDENEDVVTRKRRRMKTETFHGDHVSFKEEKMIAAALKNSLDFMIKPNHSPVNAPVFFPSLQEFVDPLAYIASIHKIVEPYGICKIVPPEGWKPPFCLDLAKLKIETKSQKINRLGEGKPYGTGKDYTFDEYFQQAKEFTKKIAKEASEKDPNFNPDSASSWELLYWKIVEGGWEEDVKVDYGNDINVTDVGSGFPLPRWNDLPPKSVTPDFRSSSYYRECGWNMTNTPRLPGSVLRNIKDRISGINVPWVYFGMPFTTFSWHNEDNYFHSINYMHLSHPDHNRPQECKNENKSDCSDHKTHTPSYRTDIIDDTPCGKVWYGISSKDTLKFESCLKQLMPQRFEQDPDLIYHITTMVSPPWLMEQGIQVSKLVQRAGEFVVTYPAAYHAGFSLSWNTAEAVNFGTLEWLEPGRICKERYRRDAREPAIAHDKLLWSLAILEGQKMTEKNDLKLILDELINLRNEEFTAREKAQNIGILYASRMPEDDIFSDEAECKRKCERCKVPCSFSAVTCPCSLDKVVCVDHTRDLCSCEESKKYLLYWKSIKDIETVIATIQNRMESVANEGKEYGT